MRSRHSRYLGIAALATVLAGTCFQVSGCLNLGGIGHYIANFNPCGTILSCDPVQYNFIRSGYTGPGANPNVDMACTYPPFCGSNDPFTSSAGYASVTQGGSGQTQAATAAPAASTSSTSTSSSSTGQP
jgi:hypothetical protein